MQLKNCWDLGAKVEENDKSSKKALHIAISSILISIFASMGAIYVSYDIYNKEDISNNTQHEELLQKIDTTNNMIEQNELLKQLLQEIKTQNKLLLNQQKEFAIIQETRIKSKN